MNSKRAQREAEFLTSGWPGMSFSQDVISSCDVLLQASLAQRKADVWREPGNHYSHHAPAVVTLIVAAFDAWITEHAFRRNIMDLEGSRQISLKPLFERAKILVGGAPSEIKLPILADLRRVIDLRDEIVHWLPRAHGDRPHIPPWFVHFEQEGLLITTRDQPDFIWAQKLSSYALAHHACAVIDRLVEEIVRRAPDEAFVRDAGASNFRFYLAAPPPSRLQSYDDANGITHYSKVAK